MELPLYQIDAFADAVFGGNPAAVCPLETWLEDDRMQAIAAENNLSETAFLVREGEAWRIRWFTPRVEVPLCGHATLASAFVVLHHLEPGAQRVRFESASGPLAVEREGERLVLDFPARPARPAEAPNGLLEGLGVEPEEVLEGPSWMAVLGDEAAVRALAPDFARLERLGKAVIATAPGEGCDFVSRFFAPQAGIPEDPVTGSAHTTLVPYWAGRLGKRRLAARQVSARGGELACEEAGARVRIGGRAVLYLEGRIHVGD